MKKLLAIALSATLLAIPAAAAAKRIPHVGGVVGDERAKVSFRLAKRHGKPKKLIAFKARNVYAKCRGDDLRMIFRVLQPIKLSRKGNYRTRLKNPDNDSVLRLTGKVRAGGRKSVGNIKTNRFKEPRTGQRCQVPKQRFSTSKR